MSFFKDWFQFGPLPPNRLEGYYDLTLVGLSYIVAVLASYVALTLVTRLKEEKNKQASIYWIIGGAFTMGAGIWSMHFIGMLAFILPMPMEYELTWTVASLFMAMLASGFALFILQKKNYSAYHLAFGGLLIGFAISTMHYMGMEGMKSHVNIHYLPSLFFLSIFIGIVAAEAALWLALESSRGSQKRQTKLKFVSALIMGVAICGMHYTGMAASVFTLSSTHSMSQEQAVQSNHLAFFIAGITALIISLALTVSSYYKKMIDAVQNEKEFLNAMLDNLEDGIIACNEKGEITVLNKTIQKNYNIDKFNKHIDHLHKYYQLFTNDNKPLPKENYPIQRALGGEVIQQLPLVVKLENGENIDVIIDGQPIINKEGKSLGAVIVVHDVTELKHTEKLKNEFVSIVSHELRTPLTSIRGSLGLLVSGVMGSFPEKANKLLDIANTNCERLLLLINDILDIEKIEAGKMEFQIKEIELNQLIRDAIDANKMYAEKYSISLQVSQPENEIMVAVDSGRLMQVLANLLSNACKFSPPDEIVTIEVKKQGDNVRVSVIDKGAGISPEFQTRIFQKFSQADSSDTRGKGGTGLGLNISKSIIEKMGGTLDFISQPNYGTTFYFELPISLGLPEQTGQLPVSGQSLKKLLICEDDLDQANYLKALLESAGFTIDIALTAGQAKEKLYSKDYQALLLDLILPDQDGIALIRELRKNQKTQNLPIIVTSIISSTGKALLNGDAVSVVDWFDKPIDLKLLLKAINHIKKPKGSNHTHSILHVEDNPDIHHVVKTLLQKYAHVYPAKNLKIAKKMLSQRTFDLIILDLMLPDGNGVDILPLLAQYKTPVLVFSDTKLSNEYSKYVSQALIKSNSSNEKLLNTIMELI